MNVRSLTLGIVLGVLLVGCISAIQYKYYGLDAVSYDGMLLGKTSADDIPFSECKPDEVTKGKCVVLKAPEFFAMKQDYETTVQRLKECEGSKNFDKR